MKNPDTNQEWKKAVGDTNRAVTRLAETVREFIENGQKRNPSTAVGEKTSISKTLAIWIPIALTLVGSVAVSVWQIAAIDKHITKVETAVRIVKILSLE